MVIVSKTSAALELHLNTKVELILNKVEVFNNVKLALLSIDIPLGKLFGLIVVKDAPPFVL